MAAAKENLDIKDKSLTFDDILIKYVGQYGKYQISRVLLLSVVNTILCFSSMSAVFIADKPSHHCELPVQMQNLNCTVEQMNSYAIPVVTGDEKPAQDECHLFDRNYSNLTELDVCPDSTSGSSNASYSDLETLKCDSWVYDTSVYDSTVVSEWNLVCERAWLAKNTAGLYMAARILGTFTCGWLSDK